MKRIGFAMLALVAFVALAQAADYGENSIPFNRRPSLMGGIGPDNQVHAVHVGLDSVLYTRSTNRQSDDNTVITVATGLTLSQASGYYLTNFVDLTLFGQLELHVDWADSLKTQASVDSVLFEIIPVGKFSTTADGYDYAINLGGNSGAADTVFAGWVFGSPKNPSMQAGIAPAGCVFQPNYIYRPGPGGGSASSVKFLYASAVPLSTKYGGWICENYMGFLVRVLSRASNALTNLHSLNIYLVAKAN